MLTQNLPSLPKHFGYNHVHVHEKLHVSDWLKMSVFSYNTRAKL